MRALLLGLALLLADLPANAAPSGPSPEVKAIEAKTVALAFRRDDGSAKGYCSGVWVSAKVILTAAHCLPDPLLGDPLAVVSIQYASKQDVLSRDGAEVPFPALRDADILIQDDGHDLALLEARGQTPPHEVAKVGLDGIETGAKVSTMGHPYGLWWSYSSGDIASVRYLDLDPAAIYVQTTAPTSPGNSGCGLFDRKGRLIGIAHAGIPSGSNLAFYIHAKHIHALLKGQGLV